MLVASSVASIMPTPAPFSRGDECVGGRSSEPATVNRRQSLRSEQRCRIHPKRHLRSNHWRQRVQANGYS
jgi:hypothetical protein